MNRFWIRFSCITLSLLTWFFNIFKHQLLKTGWHVILNVIRGTTTSESKTYITCGKFDTSSSVVGLHRLIICLWFALLSCDLCWCFVHSYMMIQFRNDWLHEQWLEYDSLKKMTHVFRRTISHVPAKKLIVTIRVCKPPASLPDASIAAFCLRSSELRSVASPAPASSLVLVRWNLNLNIQIWRKCCDRKLSRVKLYTWSETTAQIVNARVVLCGSKS